MWVHEQQTLVGGVDRRTLAALAQMPEMRELAASFLLNRSRLYGSLLSPDPTEVNWSELAQRLVDAAEIARSRVEEIDSAFHEVGTWSETAVNATEAWQAVQAQELALEDCVGTSRGCVRPLTTRSAKRFQAIQGKILEQRQQLLASTWQMRVAERRMQEEGRQRTYLILRATELEFLAGRARCGGVAATPSSVATAEVEADLCKQAQEQFGCWMVDSFAYWVSSSDIDLVYAVPLSQLQSPSSNGPDILELSAHEGMTLRAYAYANRAAPPAPPAPSAPARELPPPLPDNSI